MCMRHIQRDVMITVNGEMASLAAAASPWTSTPKSAFQVMQSKFFKFHSCPLPSSSVSSFSSSNRIVCHGGSSAPYVASHLKFVLHDALGSAGVDTIHAREAREGFCTQIQRFSDIERQTSICINRCVDLGKTALYIAAEDDSLVSHSSVPLPVDAFIERLDDLSVAYCPYYSSSLDSSPEKFLESLERFLYVEKGFRRCSAYSQTEPRSLYLHSVLTHRTGSAAMLSLIYSEILKMLRLWGLVNFDVEIFFPHDIVSLPRGYPKQKSKQSDQEHIMTSQNLLVQMLRNLKDTFWPFPHDDAKSLFLSAACAVNFVDESNNNGESGFQIASAKAAQHRLKRGVWTSVRFWDIRRALSACERLVLLETDAKELRDYSVLLYHCGYYQESLQYLKLYQDMKRSSAETELSDSLSILEEEALEKLLVRLNLILMEEGWGQPTHIRNFLGNNTEPW